VRPDGDDSLSLLDGDFRTASADHSSLSGRHFRMSFPVLRMSELLSASVIATVYAIAASELFGLKRARALALQPARAEEVS